MDVKTFSGVEDFLASPPSNTPGCLILGAGLSGSSAVDLMHEIKSRQISLPFIVLGDEDDTPQAVSVIRAGAVDFIGKPFNDHKLRRTCMKRLENSELKP